MTAFRRRVERWSGVAALGGLLATPVARPGSRAWFVATSTAVVAGAVRSVAIDARRPSVGPRRAMVVAGVTATLATAAEVIGVRSGVPFGRYRYTRALRPQLAGVPVHVALAWTAMVPAAEAAGRGVVAAAEEAASGGTVSGTSPPRVRAVREVAASALAMTAWDLFLDPQMTRDGVWVWPSAGRYRGIPASNFAGWLLLSSGLLAVRRAMTTARSMTSTTEPDGPEPVRAEPAHVESAHVATYAIMAGLSTVAFATFWRDRTVALFGGVAMLPPAFAALRRCCP